MWYLIVSIPDLCTLHTLKANFGSFLEWPFYTGFTVSLIKDYMFAKFNTLFVDNWDGLVQTTNKKIPFWNFSTLKIKCTTYD